MATFPGSDSYFASYASTGAAVDPSPAPTPVPTKDEVADQVMSQLPAFTATDLAIIAGFIVAIVIGLVNLFMLRKRK